jgi:hypothetical protein
MSQPVYEITEENLQAAFIAVIDDPSVPDSSWGDRPRGPGSRRQKARFYLTYILHLCTESNGAALVKRVFRELKRIWPGESVAHQRVKEEITKRQEVKKYPKR